MEGEKAQLQRRAIPVEKLHPAPTAGEVPSVCSQGSPHPAGGALHSHVGLPSGCMPLSQFRRSPRILISAAESVPLVTFSSFSTPRAPQSSPLLFVKCSFYLLLRLQRGDKSSTDWLIVLSSYLLTCLLTITRHLWLILLVHALVIYWAPTISWALGETLRVQGQAI